MKKKSRQILAVYPTIEQAIAFLDGYSECSETLSIFKSSQKIVFMDFFLEIVQYLKWFRVEKEWTLENKVF